jgi:hypothetical protein
MDAQEWAGSCSRHRPQHTHTCVEFGNSDCVATSPQGALEQRQLVAVGTIGSFMCRLGHPPGSLQATLQTRFLALFVPSPVTAQTLNLGTVFSIRPACHVVISTTKGTKCGSWGKLLPELHVHPPASQAEHSQPVILYPARLLGPAGLNIAPLLSNLCNDGSRRQCLDCRLLLMLNLKTCTASAWSLLSCRYVQPQQQPATVRRFSWPMTRVTYRTKAWP